MESTMQIQFAISWILILCICNISFARIDDNKEEFIAPGANSRVPNCVSVTDLKQGRYKFGATHAWPSSFEFPSWHNLTLLNIGQRFLRERFFGYMYGMSLGSTLAATSVDLRRVTLSAGSITNSEKSTKRYLMSALHFYYWATADLNSDEGRAKFYDVLNIIHSIHAKVGHSTTQKSALFEEKLLPDPVTGQNPYNVDFRIWKAFKHDLHNSELRKFRSTSVFPPLKGGTDVYLNQFALSVLQWGISALPVLAPEKVLIYDATEEQLLGYLHFWAVIGQGLGIEDDYNICLQPNVASAREYFRRMLEEYFVPALFDLDYETMMFMEAGPKAVHKLLPFASVGHTVLSLCSNILQIECPTVRMMAQPDSQMYDMLLDTAGKPLLRLDAIQSIARFVVRGLIQVPSLKYFGFNALYPRNFTEGLIELDEKLLRESDVHYNSTWISYNY